MKTKTPLYVVKGKTVLEAKGVFDMIVKKLSLEPVLEIFMNIVNMLLKQVTNYSSFIAVKTFIDHMIERMFKLVSRLGIA